MSSSRRVGIAAVVLAATACTRQAASVDGGSGASAKPDASAEASAEADASAKPDASAETPDARAARPIVFHAFRRSASFGKVDDVSPRAYAGDGELDGVFELDIEGDVASITVWSEAASLSASTQTRTSPPPPAASGSLVPPPRLSGAKRPFPVLKHAPQLYVVDARAVRKTEDPSVVPASNGERRTLHLSTWIPLDPIKGPWHVVAFAPDGTWREGPLAR